MGSLRSSVRERSPWDAGPAKRPAGSHPEVRAVNARDSRRRPGHLDLRHGRAPEEEEKKFAGRTVEPSSRFAFPNRDELGGSRPLDLQPDLVQPAAQVPATSVDVAPQGGLQRGRQPVARAQAVRPAHVLLVDEELVQAREGANPPDPEEPRRRARPDPPDEPPELPLPRQPRPAALSEPLKRPGKDHAGASERIVLTQHEVSGDVARGPPLQQGGCVSAEFFEQVAQCEAFLRVKRKITHPTRPCPIERPTMTSPGDHPTSHSRQIRSFAPSLVTACSNSGRGPTWGQVRGSGGRPWR